KQIVPYHRTDEQEVNDNLLLEIDLSKFIITGPNLYRRSIMKTACRAIVPYIPTTSTPNQEIILATTPYGTPLYKTPQLEDRSPFIIPSTDIQQNAKMANLATAIEKYLANKKRSSQ